MIKEQSTRAGWKRYKRDNFMNFVVCITMTSLLALSPSTLAYWTNKGNQAIVSIGIPKAKKPFTSASLMVSYSKQLSCRPVVSVIMFIGNKLGTPTKQHTTTTRSSQLSVIVDGMEFSDTSKATRYTNAMEMAMFASPGLITSLSHAKSIVAKLGNTGTQIDFSFGSNFESANADALGQCN